MNLLTMQFSLSPVTSSLLSPNILLSTLFSNIFNLSYSDSAYQMFQISCPFSLPKSFQRNWARSRSYIKFRNKLYFFFYDEEMSASRPIFMVEDLPLSVDRDCLLKILAATLHIWRPSPQSTT